MDKEDKIPSDLLAFMRELIDENLRDWNKEQWVRITTSGKIAGPCGTSKDKTNPDRCLPKNKAQSLTQGERAATARKKKAAGSKGQTVVPNTKASKVTKESIVELIIQALSEKSEYNPTQPEKWAYAKSQAKARYDTYPSAYANQWASKKYKELGGRWRKVKKKKKK